jgi:hypothetical protein
MLDHMAPQLSRSPATTIQVEFETGHGKRSSEWLVMAQTPGKRERPVKRRGNINQLEEDTPPAKKRRVEPFRP